MFVGLAVYCVHQRGLGYFMPTATHFFILAILVGMVQGGTQALSRSLFASMIPKHKSSEFFAFFGVFERYAGILGPLDLRRDGAGDRARAGTRSSRCSCFFVVGGALLVFVDVDEWTARSARGRSASITRV